MNRIMTSEVENYIKSNYVGIGPKQMALIVNGKYGTAYTKGQIKNYYARNKLNSGLSGCFEKGQIPHNKGIKRKMWMSPQGEEKCRQTQIRKDKPIVPVAPIGEVRIRKDHLNRKGIPYKWIKVEQPNKWRMLNRVVWEEHFGAIPKGAIITFADGDSLNCDISNLVLTTRAQNVIRNNLGLKSYNRESSEAINKIADIKILIRRKNGKKSIKK